MPLPIPREPPVTSAILSFSSIILLLNSFLKNCRQHRQTSGSGAPSALAYRYRTSVRNAHDVMQKPRQTEVCESAIEECTAGRSDLSSLTAKCRPTNPNSQLVGHS